MLPHYYGTHSVAALKPVAPPYPETAEPEVAATNAPQNEEQETRQLNRALELYYMRIDVEGRE